MYPPPSPPVQRACRTCDRCQCALVGDIATLNLSDGSSPEVVRLCRHCSSRLLNVMRTFIRERARRV